MLHSNKKLLSSLFATLAIGALTGCNPQAKGFALPPGDAERGKEAFLAMGCNACHSIDNSIEKLEEGGDAQIHVVLGGQVTRVKTYGDLVTSIINPNHRLSRGTDPTTIDSFGQSKMPTYNEVMTVQQLLDLTSLLQASYKVWIPDYGPYYYP